MSVEIKRTKCSIQWKRGKVCIGIVFLFVVTIEWASYWLKAQQWPQISCQSGDDNCLRLLLVADPQIIGERNEMGFPIGAIARWDSDRYLAKTFKQAENHVRPHAIVFLGDLMDEGSVSTYAQFDRYYERFSKIFSPTPGVQMVYLPGDNDIGGENEPITHEKITKFQEKFGQPDVVHVKETSLIKVNRLRYTVPKLPARSMNETRIILSHLPLLPHPSPFIEHVLTSLQPHLILSAHDHKASHTSSARDGKFGVSGILQEPLSLQLRNMASMHELLLPTCSYRMGVPNMGYGALALDTQSESLELTMQILWLPGRFPQLLAYAALVITICLIYTCLHFTTAKSKPTRVRSKLYQA